VSDPGIIGDMEAEHWILVSSVSLLAPVAFRYIFSLVALFGSRRVSESAFRVLSRLTRSKIDPQNADQAEQIVEGYLASRPPGQRITKK
jgi:hypothetical protein